MPDHFGTLCIKGLKVVEKFVIFLEFVQLSKGAQTGYRVQIDWAGYWLQVDLEYGPRPYSKSI